jgi:hypothetical protein
MQLDDPSRLVKEILAHYDAPAFVRRARAVQDAFDKLMTGCRRQREEWLQSVRMDLGVLRARAGDWRNLLPWLAGEMQLDVLAELDKLLQPRPRVSVPVTSSPGKLPRALVRLLDGIERFKRRWCEFLAGLDLDKVNRLRDGYNRYYLLEKECALRSARLAQLGFRRLEPLTAADLGTLLPPLPVPQLKRQAASRA